MLVRRRFCGQGGEIDKEDASPIRGSQNPTEIPSVVQTAVAQGLRDSASKLRTRLKKADDVEQVFDRCMLCAIFGGWA